MNTGEQAADPVHGAGDFAGEVVVVSDDHAEFGERVVADIDAAQRMRHGAGRVGDDEGIARVGLGLSRIQIRDSAHRKPGQVGDVVTARAGYGDRQRADRVGLVDHDQQPAMCRELVEHRP